MGLGTGLAFIAIGAILAFATNFSVSGIDVQAIGWILMIVGLASIAFTMMYVRPRRQRLVADPIVEEPVVDVHPDDPVPPHLHVDPPVQQQPVQPTVQQPTVQPGQATVRPGQATVRPGQAAPHVQPRGSQDLQP